ncbi:MAG: hypothetical protein ACUVXF_09695 [Desulfobaccales bacterium]
MKVYLPKELLKEISDLLVAEGVSFEVTNETYAVRAEGKDIAEIAEIDANLLETEVPVLLEAGPETGLRAFRLPSGTRFLLTDAAGNFVRVAQPPRGWER